MKRPVRFVELAVPMLAVSALVAACSSSSSSSSAPSSSPGASSGSGTPSSTPAGPAPGAKVSGTLNGSGSTFQKAYNDQVVTTFDQKNSGATINYQAKGSGAGQTDLQNGVVDFAGSDVLVKAADVSKFKGGDLLYFPTISGPITVSYKLSGVSSLQLSATSLAKIFSRMAKTWDDPAIKADNPGASLPSTPIVVAHRSDASGTTANFTSFLKKADPTDWTLGSATTVQWAPDTQGGTGNNGVAQIVKNTDGAIGYVDYSDAKVAGLVFAQVRTAGGRYVTATLDGASEAVKNATVAANLTYDPINAPGDASYPITSPTYIITYAKYTDASKVALLKAFLSYIEGPEGQAAAKDVDFAALPSDLAQKALAQAGQITAG